MRELEEVDITPPIEEHIFSELRQVYFAPLIEEPYISELRLLGCLMWHMGFLVQIYLKSNTLAYVT